jgi:HEAT repeat protein
MRKEFMLRFTRNNARTISRPLLFSALGPCFTLFMLAAPPCVHVQSVNLKHEIANLSDPAPSIRQSAARTLGEMGDIRAAEPLMQALRDQSTRAAAAYALGQLKDPGSISALVLALKDENQEVRENAAMALGEFRDRRAVVGLIDALNSQNATDPDGNFSAADSSLGRIGALSVSPLVAELQRKNSSVRMHAVEALGWVDDSRAFNATVAALKDPDPGVRAAAAGGLNGHGDAPGMLLAPYNFLGWFRSGRRWGPSYTRDPRVIDLLISALRDPDAVVRSNAVEKLGQIGTSRAVEPLLAVLSDASSAASATRWGPTIQMTIIEALGRIGDARALDALVSALQSPTEAVRQHAAGALGDIKDPRAMVPLIAALNDKSPSVQASAAKSLGQIKDPRAVEPLAETLDKTITELESAAPGYDPRYEVVENAAKALGEIGDARAIPPLLVTLKSMAALMEKTPASPSARFAVPQVTEALGKLGASAVDALSAASKNPDAQIRAQALTALAATRDARALPLLTQALGDDDADVRGAVAQALAMFHDPRAEEPLMKAMKDSEKQVRVSATRGLCFNPSPWVVNPLLAALRDPDSDFMVSCVTDNVGGMRAPITDQFLPLLKDPDARTRELAAQTLVAQIQFRSIMKGTSDPAVAPVIQALLARLHENDRATIKGAFVFFVLLGQPDSEGALIDTLQHETDEYMAQSLLTCGNAKLEDAGRAWYAQHHMQPEDFIVGVFWGKLTRRADSD